MSSRCFRRINVFRLFLKSRLCDGNIFLRIRFRPWNNHGLHNRCGRRWSWFGFEKCHLRFWRRRRLRFFFRLGRSHRLHHWRRRNDDWFWFGLRWWRLGQRDVNVSFIQNLWRLWLGRFQTKKNDGVKRQRERVKNDQRTFHCFNFVSIATFVMPAFRKSSSTSTAAPKKAFSSPLMKTLGSA